MQGRTCTCLRRREGGGRESSLAFANQANLNNPPSSKKSTVACLLGGRVHDLPPPKAEGEVWPCHVAFVPAVVVPEDKQKSLFLTSLRGREGERGSRGRRDWVTSWARKWRVDRRRLPDGVSGAAAVDLAVLVQDDVGFQVSVIVVCGVVVGHDPRWDPQAAQDCREEGQEMGKRVKSRFRPLPRVTVLQVLKTAA